MKMRNIIYILVFIFINVSPLTSSTNSTTLNASYFTPASPPPSDPGFGSQFMVGLGKANLSHDVKKAQEICDKAIEAGRYIDKLTGGNLESMPIVKKQKFGETEIFIIFQSAKIYPQYAVIEVYVKIDFHKKDFNGQNSILYFGAKNIYFSQEKGLIQGSVGLLADYAVKLGDNSDKAGIYFKKMEATLVEANNPTTELDDEYQYNGTYVNFDCDGFKEMGIGGAVFFSRDWLIPTNEFGEPRQANAKDMSSTPRVNAHFQIVAQDFNDIFVNLSIDHFVLASWDKMSFYLGNANLDLSSYRNPGGIPYDEINAIGNAWEGVYIEAITITLPKHFKRTNNSFVGGNNSGGPPPRDRIKVSAKHLLIDDLGVMGEFSIVGQAPLIGGPIMDGEWGWSLDSIGFNIKRGMTLGDLEFGFRGGLGVPILSKEGPMEYTCSLDFGADKYNFTAATHMVKKFPIWNAAQVEIVNPIINMSVEGDEFKPEVIFSSVQLKIGNPNDYATSQQGSPVQMPGISVTNMKLRSVAPYITVGAITLNTGGSKVVGFPVTISNPTLISGTDNELSLAFSLGINLMDEGSGVSATGDLAIRGVYTRDLNGRRKWDFERLDFGGASVTVSLPQFYGQGQLCLFEDDPEYGKGFSASILCKIIGDNLNNPSNSGKFQLWMKGVFGSTQGYRYWLVDGFVKSNSFSVPIVPGVIELNGFGGGAFHHMRQAAYNASLANGAGASCAAGAGDYCGIVYKPNKETKLGIKFSTSFTGSGGMISGLLTCILRFGNTYNLQNIMFWGTADIMVPADVAEKVVKDVTDKLPDIVKSTEQEKKDNKDKVAASSNKIMANVGISIDFEHGFVFHALADVKIELLEALKGHGTLDILADDPHNRWHFWLGGYYDGTTTSPGFFDDTPVTLLPVSIELDYGGFNVGAQSYFLTGNDIPGPPPLPQDVADFFDIPTSTNNRGKLTCEGRSPAMGTGFAFGANCYFDFTKFKKGVFGSCFPGYKLDLGGKFGFDLALLKYGSNTSCQSGLPIGGFNGLRATGRVYGFINVESGHVVCIPIPHFGVGILLGFDVVKPSYLQGVVVLDFIKKMRFKAAFGEECGTPCVEGPID